MTYKGIIKARQAEFEAYIPEAKAKQSKAVIRGLWYSKGQGLCYDYLRKVKIEAKHLPFIKKHYKQEAIFYRDICGVCKGKAYIYYSQSKRDILERQTYFGYTGKRGLKAYIKDILKRFGGLTVYIRGNNYLIEVWK